MFANTRIKTSINCLVALILYSFSTVFLYGVLIVPKLVMSLYITCCKVSIKAIERLCVKLYTLSQSKSFGFIFINSSCNLVMNSVLPVIVVNKYNKSINSTNSFTDNPLF